MIKRRANFNATLRRIAWQHISSGHTTRREDFITQRNIGVAANQISASLWQWTELIKCPRVFHTSGAKPRRTAPTNDWVFARKSYLCTDLPRRFFLHRRTLRGTPTGRSIHFIALFVTKRNAGAFFFFFFFFFNLRFSFFFFSCNY